MKFKDFEIRPTTFLDGHKDQKRWDVVKWCKREKPISVYDLDLCDYKMSDTYCFSVAFLEWNNKKSCWEMRSVGTRFLEYYEEGLCEFILKWLELTDLTRRFTEEA